MVVADGLMANATKRSGARGCGYGYWPGYEITSLSVLPKLISTVLWDDRPKWVDGTKNPSRLNESGIRHARSSWRLFDDPRRWARVSRSEMYGRWGSPA